MCAAVSVSVSASVCGVWVCMYVCACVLGRVLVVNWIRRRQLRAAQQETPPITHSFFDCYGCCGAVVMWCCGAALCRKVEHVKQKIIDAMPKLRDQHPDGFHLCTCDMNFDSRESAR